MTQNNGGPAFPRDWQYPGHNGMSLRDWFAGHALAGDLANGDGGTYGNDAKDEYLVDRAMLYYRIADAMIAARDSEVGN